MPEETPLKFFYASITVEDDGKPLATLSRRPVKLYGLDIQVQDYGADMGDRNGQTLELGVGDSYSQNNWAYPIDTQDLWFKNHSGGSNATVVVAGYYK